QSGSTSDKGIRVHTRHTQCIKAIVVLVQT
ncbi:MAG: hypothetical protein ACI9XB_005134, partial [Gammaproteobacteria bacterium]